MKTKCRGCLKPVNRADNLCFGCRQVVCLRCSVRGHHFMDGPHWVPLKKDLRMPKRKEVRQMAKGHAIARQESARLTAIPGGRKIRSDSRKLELVKLLRFARRLGKAVSFPVAEGIAGHKSPIGVLLYTLFNTGKAISGQRIKTTSKDGRLVAWLVPAPVKAKSKRRATRQRSS